MSRSCACGRSFVSPSIICPTCEKEVACPPCPRCTLLAHYRKAHPQQTALDVATAMKTQARELERRFIDLTETHDHLKETLTRLEVDIKGTYSNMRTTISSMTAEWQERSEERRSVPEDIFREVVNDYKVAVAVSLGKDTDRIAGLEKSLQIYWIYNSETLSNARQEYNASCIILNPAMTLDNPKLPKARRDRLAEARRGGFVRDGFSYSMGMRGAVTGSVVVLPSIMVTNHCMMVGSPFPEELSLMYRHLDLLQIHRSDPGVLSLLARPVVVPEEVQDERRVTSVGRLMIETPLADLCSSWSAGYHLPACLVQGDVVLTARTLLSMLVVSKTVYSRSNSIVDLVRAEELDAVGSVLIKDTFVRTLARIDGRYVPEAEEVLPSVPGLAQGRAHGAARAQDRDKRRLNLDATLAHTASKKRLQKSEVVPALAQDDGASSLSVEQRLAAMQGEPATSQNAPYTSVMNCYFAGGAFLDNVKKLEGCYCSRAVLAGQTIATHCVFDELEIRPDFVGMVFSSKVGKLIAPSSSFARDAFFFDCDLPRV